MAKFFNLSEAVTIGLHSMVVIAKSKEMMNVVSVSEAIGGSSKHHVAKVLQRLVKDDILVSLRGPLGGFALKKKPEEVSLLEIFESIEGKIEITNCPLENPICPFDKCILGGVANKLTKEFKKFLEEQTLNKYL